MCVTAALAARKGYNFFLWIFAGGIIGLLILMFLPFVNDKSNLSCDERQRQRKTGNTIAGAISLIVIMLNVLLAITRMS